MKLLIVTEADFANAWLIGPHARLRRLLKRATVVSSDATRGFISVLDPLGRALLGASPGEVIQCSIPGGRYRVRVEKLVYQPKHSLRTHLVTNDSPARGA